MTPDDITQILGEHADWKAVNIAPGDEVEWHDLCDCGHDFGFSLMNHDPDKAHRAHLAAVLHRNVAAAQADFIAALWDRRYEAQAEAWDLLAGEVEATAQELRGAIDWRAENPWNPANWTTPEAGLNHAIYLHLRARADRLSPGDEDGGGE